MTHIRSLDGNLRPCICRSVGADMAPGRNSDRAFVAVSASLFAISVALTVASCASMSAMRGMPMPDGWTMSMMWMRMPGQTWIDCTASFLSMWVAMMAAMMLPSHAPMLWRYRQAIRSMGESRIGLFTLLAALGYLFVWILLGLAIFPLGVVLAEVEMEQPVLARGVPVIAGAVILIAGAVQLTSWKAHHVARCREMPARACILPADAWREGMRFGLHCTLSCGNWTAILLALGVMDLRVMTLLTAAITAERLAPAGKRFVRATGGAAIVTGLFMIAQHVA